MSSERGDRSDMTADRLIELEAENASLRAEVARLREPYKSGDKESQAAAWCAVNQECQRLGLLSYWEGERCGRDRVIGFIRHLAKRVTELEDAAHTPDRDRRD